MLIGVDFDNTIVCYDDLFHHVAYEQGLIPADLPPRKSAVRDYLRQVNQEDAWTEMQGYVYGKRMIADAHPYPGVLEFFLGCQARKIPACIISHKTRYPYIGEKRDLHTAAMQWLELHGFMEFLRPEQIFLELTKADKLRRIASAGCTHFIDDLPEFLSEADFPDGVQRILFDPYGIHPNGNFHKTASWDDITALLLDGQDA